MTKLQNIEILELFFSPNRWNIASMLSTSPHSSQLLPFTHPVSLSFSFNFSCSNFSFKSCRLVTSLPCRAGVWGRERPTEGCRGAPSDPAGGRPLICDSWLASSPISANLLLVDSTRNWEDFIIVFRLEKSRERRISFNGTKIENENISN